MGRRYDNRKLFTNKNVRYEKVLDDRGVKSIVHYNTARMFYPSQRDLTQLTKIRHVWTTGDRYYKLAHQYYGSTQYWWVIAQFNQKPTEADVTVGEVIFIPTPLEAILRAYKGG
jgi:nucleoid-associated protein YgaU